MTIHRAKTNARLLGYLSDGGVDSRRGENLRSRLHQETHLALSVGTEGTRLCLSRLLHVLAFFQTSFHRHDLQVERCSGYYMEHGSGFSVKDSRCRSRCKKE